MSKTLITTDHQKGRHWLKNLCATAYNKAKLTEDRAQKLNERGGEFQKKLGEVIAELAPVVPKEDSLLTDEEVSSDATYPREYRGLRPIEEQVEILHKGFPGLNVKNVLRYAKYYRRRSLPRWVEGPLVVPTVEALTRIFFPRAGCKSEIYNAVLLRVMEKLAEQREFMNVVQEALEANEIQQTSRTERALASMAARQSGDLLILPVQLGHKERGRSANRSERLYERGTSEAGLHSLAGCVCALTHPERFVRSSELDMTLPGDVAPFQKMFTRRPCIYIAPSSETLIFGKEGTFDRVNPEFGAATFYFG